MKKFLGFTLALAMLFPAGQANAELLKNLKFSGQLDTQSTAARNTVDFATRAPRHNSADGTSSTILNTGGLVPADGQDRIGDTQSRILVSADWDLLDDVHYRSTLRKSNRVWGNASQDLNAVQTTVFVD